MKPLVPVLFLFLLFNKNTQKEKVAAVEVKTNELCLLPLTHLLPAALHNLCSAA